jgi:hypothetical protein
VNCLSAAVILAAQYAQMRKALLRKLSACVQFCSVFFLLMLLSATTQMFVTTTVGACALYGVYMQRCCDVFLANLKGTDSNSSCTVPSTIVQLLLLLLLSDVCVHCLCTH